MTLEFIKKHYMNKTKKIAVWAAAVVGLAAVIFSGYTLYRNQQVKYYQSGYNRALLDIVTESEKGPINIKAGDKQVSLKRGE